MCLILATIQSYNTGREHQIACENTQMLEKICASRFGYSLLPRFYVHVDDSREQWLEPNWCVRQVRPLQ